jgi:hypothetical protein
MKIITPQNVAFWDNNFLEVTSFTRKPFPTSFLGGFRIRITQKLRLTERASVSRVELHHRSIPQTTMPTRHEYRLYGNSLGAAWG